MVQCSPQQTCMKKISFLQRCLDGQFLEPYYWFLFLLYTSLLISLGLELYPVSWRSYLRYGISIWVDVPLDYLANEFLISEVSSSIMSTTQETDPFSKVSFSFFETLIKIPGMSFSICFLVLINSMELHQQNMRKIKHNFFIYTHYFITAMVLVPL